MRSAFGDVERPIKATNTFSFQIPVCSLHTGKYRQVISQEVNKIKQTIGSALGYNSLLVLLVKVIWSSWAEPPTDVNDRARGVDDVSRVALANVQACFASSVDHMVEGDPLECTKDIVVKLQHSINGII